MKSQIHVFGTMDQAMEVFIQLEEAICSGTAIDNVQKKPA